MREFNILNLGAGVQSSVVALMMCKGELPKVDVAVFSDTGWEPKSVYIHLDWLEQEMAAAGIPLRRVSVGRSIKDDALNSQVPGLTGDGTRYASLPYFIRKDWGPDDLPFLKSEIERSMNVAPQARPRHGMDRYHQIAEIIGAGGTIRQDGMIRRQCTGEYKIRPIEKFIRRELLGLKPRQRVPKDVIVRSWYGISIDEAQRMRTPEEPWRRNIYPLCGVPDDLLASPMNRAACRARGEAGRVVGQ